MPELAPSGPPWSRRAQGRSSSPGSGALGRKGVPVRRPGPRLSPPSLCFSCASVSPVSSWVSGVLQTTISPQPLPGPSSPPVLSSRPSLQIPPFFSFHLSLAPLSSLSTSLLPSRSSSLSASFFPPSTLPLLLFRPSPGRRRLARRGPLRAPWSPTTPARPISAGRGGRATRAPARRPRTPGRPAARVVAAAAPPAPPSDSRPADTSGSRSPRREPA